MLIEFYQEDDFFQDLDPEGDEELEKLMREF